jgi:peroxiredoxin Q/BCP
MTETIRLEPGQNAPAFTLPNQDDKKIALRDLNGMWVVVYFYPKDDTPGCTTEACDFTAGLKGFEKLNARVIGISPDSPESHKKFIAKHSLKVTLLADPDRKALAKYGAWGTKKLYGKEHVGVIRSTFIIDPKGKIGYAWYGVKATGHAEKVAAKLKELAG